MSGNGNGHSWSKFFWRDWQNDLALKSCSLEAQGYWMRLLCVMHEGTPVGYLSVNGEPMSARQMAVSAGISEKKSAKLLQELECEGVFSRSENGTIFCRRMVRDAEASEIGRENAKKRWDNKPTHPNGVGNGVSNGGPNAKSQNKKEEKESNPPNPPPSGGATPPSGDPGRARADLPPQSPREAGTNLRAIGTNPRAVGGNHRGNGTIPRANAAFKAVMRERWGDVVTINGHTEEVAHRRLAHG